MSNAAFENGSYVVYRGATSIGHRIGTDRVSFDQPTTFNSMSKVCDPLLEIFFSTLISNARGKGDKFAVILGYVHLIARLKRGPN